MGLFKKKQPVFNEENVLQNKKKMRDLFNMAIENGSSYQILYAGSTNSQFNSFTNTRTTTYENYIVGYREEDYDVIVLTVDQHLTTYSIPIHIDINMVKETTYYRDCFQAWFIYQDSDRLGYGTKLEIMDSPSNVNFMTSDIKQQEEREAFLDFFEKYTNRLREMGHKIKPWKR